MNKINENIKYTTSSVDKMIYVDFADMSKYVIKKGVKIMSDFTKANEICKEEKKKVKIMSEYNSNDINKFMTDKKIWEIILNIFEMNWYELHYIDLMLKNIKCMPIDIKIDRKTDSVFVDIKGDDNEYIKDCLDKNSILYSNINYNKYVTVEILFTMKYYIEYITKTRLIDFKYENDIEMKLITKEIFDMLKELDIYDIKNGNVIQIYKYLDT